MARIEGDGASGGEVRDARPTEGGILETAIEATPWWSVSAAVHLVAIVICMLVLLPGAHRPVAEALRVRVRPAKMEEVRILPLRDLVEMPEIQRDDNPIEEQEFEAPVEAEIEMPNPPEGGVDRSLEEPNKEYSDNTIGTAGSPGEGMGDRPGWILNSDGAPGSSKRHGPTDEAVLAGLRWLARHQSPDGSWSADGFSAQCRGTICEGAGSRSADTGVTGLALLAFLGAGYTHMSREKYRDPYLDEEICIGKVVQRAVRWLSLHQDSEGCFGGQGGGKYMYNHACAALAMVEAYGMTGSHLLKTSAQKGVDFTMAAQNPYKGWRYTKRCGDNDTSVTGWCVMVLKSANLAGLSVSDAGYQGSMAWIEEVTDDTYYKTGYTAKGTGLVVTPENEGFAPHEALTAVGMMCRAFVDHDKGDPALEGGARLLVNDLPEWNPQDKKIDYYYWYYGSLALFQFDGPNGKYWGVWNKAMVQALAPHQATAKDSCADGSWEADTKNGIGRWAFEGGRVYATAINTLTLEVYYRYRNAFTGDRKRTAEKK